MMSVTHWVFLLLFIDDSVNKHGDNTTPAIPAHHKCLSLFYQLT
ncbi:hypothetical protein BN2497_3113 [Janthinobacterium sp. CG23_2]|nr:hypothetical protein BN2497_3113 [Janthinobacterium sp. CG23_2]CUU27954.1 hypothetical protein BN3177_3113 [Janthinobacterium sp. CG23_2]